MNQHQKYKYEKILSDKESRRIDRRDNIFNTVMTILVFGFILFVMQKCPKETFPGAGATPQYILERSLY